MLSEKKLITSKELSELTSIPVSALQKMVREKTLPALSVNGRTFLFQPDIIIPLLIKKYKIN